MYINWFYGHIRTSAHILAIPINIIFAHMFQHRTIGFILYVALKT